MDARTDVCMGENSKNKNLVPNYQVLTHTLTMSSTPAIKYALLVGINYKGSQNELSGCINDVTDMRAALIQYFGYAPEHITLISDDTDIKPTRANILAQLALLCSHADASQVFFHYSGHGSYVRDTNHDESDGRDECICPV